jgi:hypothetical protein
MRRYLVMYTSKGDAKVHSVDLKSDDADRAVIFAKAINRGLDKYISSVQACSMALDLKSMPEKEVRKLFNKLGYDLKIVRISK